MYVLDTLPQPKTVSLINCGGNYLLYTGVRGMPVVVTEINTQDCCKKPSGSDIEVDGEASSRSMLIPPLGLSFFKSELRTLCVNFLVGGVWVAISCGFVAFFCYPKNPDFLSVHGVVDAMWILLAVWFGLGCVVGLMNAGVHAVRGWQVLGLALCQSELTTTSEALRITKTGLMPRQCYTYPLSDISTIGVVLKDNRYCFADLMIGWNDTDGLDVNCPAMSRLLVHFHDHSNATFLVGRDTDELRWIGTVVRSWLNVESSEF